MVSRRGIAQNAKRRIGAAVVDEEHVRRTDRQLVERLTGAGQEFGKHVFFVVDWDGHANLHDESNFVPYSTPGTTVMISRVLGFAPAYRLWQSPFAAQKMRPIISHS